MRRERRTKNRIHEGHEGHEDPDQNQEPRTENRVHEAGAADDADGALEVSELVAENSKLKTQNSKLRAQLGGLTALLQQIGEAVDVLGGEELDVWQEGGRWYWRWQDTSAVAPHPLRSHGTALVDAVEHRAGLLAPPE